MFDVEPLDVWAFRKRFPRKRSGRILRPHIRETLTKNMCNFYSRRIVADLSLSLFLSVLVVVIRHCYWFYRFVVFKVFIPEFVLCNGTLIHDR